MARRSNKSTGTRPRFQGADKETTKFENERPENIETCKYRFILCPTVEICFHTFTTRNHNSSGR